MTDTNHLNEAIEGDGFYLMKGVIPPALINKWQQLAAQFESTALHAHRQNQQIPAGTCVVEDAVGPRVMRVDDLYVNAHESLRELLSLEPFVAMTRALVGPHALVIQSDLLYKHQHPHPVIKWHQGAPHSRKYPYLNIGIYLDDADENDGCLRYMPGTQGAMQDIAAVEREHGWNPPGVVQVPAQAGDILIQDMMILHSSEPKRSAGARKTVYVELRPYEAIVEENEEHKGWAEIRRAFTASAFAKSDVLTAEEKAWYQQAEVQNTPLADQLKELHIPPIPAVYAQQNNEGPDYPVPADLL